MRNSAPAVVGAATVLAAGAPALWLLTLDPLAAHMAIHIALMNVAAPLAAILLVRDRPAQLSGSKWLWLAAAAQLLLLWASHAPPVHRVATDSALIRFCLWAALFLTALGFWSCMVSRRRGPPWQEILALLVTGKLACLLAALLVFAARPLYAVEHHPTIDLTDQQLAGLLMLAACPLSYVLAAVVLAAKMLTDLQRKADEVSRLMILRRQTA